MDEQRARLRGSEDLAAGAPEVPELPTEKAFVLQLSRGTGPTLEPFAGRVEHLRTGRRLAFESLAAFQAAVIRLLAEAGRTRDEGDREADR